MVSRRLLMVLSCIPLVLALGCRSSEEAEEPEKSPSATLVVARAVTALAAVLEAAAHVADPDSLETFQGFGIAMAGTPDWLREAHPERRELAEAVAGWPDERKAAALDWVRENATWTSLLHAMAIESFDGDFEPREWGPSMAGYKPTTYASRVSLAPLLQAAIETPAIARIAEQVSVQTDPFTAEGVHQRRSKLFAYLRLNDDVPPIHALYDPLLAPGYGVNAVLPDGSIWMIVGPMNEQSGRSMALYHEMAHQPVNRVLARPAVAAALDESRCAFEKIETHFGYDDWTSFFGEALVRSLSYRLEGVEARDTGLVFEAFLTAALEQWETSDTTFEDAVVEMLQGIFNSHCREPCPAPFEMLPSGTCLALPEGASADLPVVVYLHGMTSSASWALGEGKKLATKGAGDIVVLAPLGQKGACDWSPDVAEHHCWTQGNRPKDQRALAELVETLRGDLLQVQKAMGRNEPIAPILVGFSNGGFGVAALAFTTDLELGGLVVLHAGTSVPIETKQDVPTLLRAALGDEWHHPTMVTLRDRLAAVGWAATWEEREGAHALDDSDLASIVRFVNEQASPAGGANP